MSKKKFRLRNLVTLGFILLIMLLGFLVGLNLLVNKHIEMNFQSCLNSVDQMFQRDIEREAELFDMVIESLQKDKTFQKAWVSQDRNKFLHVALPIYRNILNKSHVTHFNIYSSDSSYVLSVHDPSGHSDCVDCYTLKKAVIQQGIAHGVELGMQAKLTMRVVHPWFIRDKLVGYIELGLDIEDIFTGISGILDVELFLAVNKQYLDRAQWEDCLKLNGHTGGWGKYSNFVIRGETLDDINLTNLDIYKNGNPCYGEQFYKMFNITSECRQYLGGIVNLKDIKERQVGHIVVIDDVTGNRAEMLVSVAYIIMSITFIFILMLMWFLFSSHRVAKGLILEQDDLKETTDEGAKEFFNNDGKYRYLFDNISIPIVYYTLDGKIFTINKICAKEFGGTPKDLNGKFIFDLFPDKSDLIMERIGLIIETGMTYDFEDMDENSSEGRWSNMNFQAVRKENGELFAIQVFSYDITDCKKLNKAFDESKERFFSFMNAATEAFFLYDYKLNLYDINSEGLKILGVKKEDAVGINVSEIIGEGTDTLRYEKYKNIIVTGEAFIEEGKNIISMIGDRSVIIKSFKVSNGIGMVLTDVTNLNECKNSQDRNEKYYRTLIENSTDLITLIDDEGIIHYTSPSIKRLLGYTEGELLGENIYNYIHPDEITESILLISRFDNEDRKNNEFRMKHKNGGWRVIEVSSRMIFDEKNMFSRILLNSRDVTEKNEMQSQLIKSKEVAEAANISKSIFLANMSHEIRTPMNGVLGMTELMLGTEISAEQREYLDMIKSSADSLLRIINDILDFSKIEAGRMDLDNIHFFLRSSIDMTMKMLAFRADKKDLKLTYDIASDIYDAVIGDPGRLRQVVINLVGNAIKFTSKGGVSLNVEKESESNNEMCLKFVVADSGIGIPPEKQDQIFKAFEQADGSTTRNHGGSGLGLAISAKLINMMDGEIWIESPINHDEKNIDCPGSAFYFTCKFKKQEKFDVIEVKIKPEHLKGLKVLVIDDSVTLLRLVHDLLSSWGMEATVVEDGMTALDILEKKEEKDPFSLIILDKEMPMMNGFSFAEKINQNPKISMKRIIILTAMGQRGDAAVCKELGILGYLMKPIDQFQLFEAIINVLGKTVDDKMENSLITKYSLNESHRSMKILLAEDNLINRKLVVRMLEKMDHIIKVASNGKEAVEMSEKEDFDMILMDGQMPVMDGLTATAEIRKREQKTDVHIPIVAQTAHALKGDRERFISSGMDDYIIKPVKAIDLMRVIERFSR